MSESSRSEWGGLGCLILVFFAWDLVVEPIWYSTFRYSVQYGVEYSSVTRLKKPHKCDFFAAPIGNKHCSYEAQVSLVKTAISTEGKPIVSFDEGKTWMVNDGTPPAKPSAYITWKKVDDDED
jgi:hypothetical protein